jgi:hypothetical protein
MNKYSIEDGLIIDNTSNTLINSKYIFAIIDTELKDCDLGVRFSKIGVSFEIALELDDVKISLNIYAKKGDNKYLVRYKNKRFADYIIIDNVWH